MWNYLRLAPFFAITNANNVFFLRILTKVSRFNSDFISFLLFFFLALTVPCHALSCCRALFHRAKADLSNAWLWLKCKWLPENCAIHQEDEWTIRKCYPRHRVSKYILTMCAFIYVCVLCTELRFAFLFFFLRTLWNFDFAIFKCSGLKHFLIQFVAINKFSVFVYLALVFSMSHSIRALWNFRKTIVRPVLSHSLKLFAWRFNSKFNLYSFLVE